MSRARVGHSPELGTMTALGAESVPMPGSPGRSNAPDKLGRHNWFCGGLINQGFVSPRRHVVRIQFVA